MKKVLSVILAVCMLVSVFAIVPMAAGAEAATKTIQVGVIEYLNLTGQYQVHYWGGATSGDVNVTPINTQKMKSVGNEFWDGDEQKFNMNEAAIPADATGFKVHCGDTWFGEDGVVADSNQAFVFEWGNVYRALYAYEAPAADPTTAPTEAPTTAPTSAPETEAPIVGGTTYYVVGSFTDWGTDAEYALTANAATEGEYMITGVALAKDDEFKVVGVQGGVQGGTTWYPDNADNYKVAADGTYDIYFRPDGQGGEGWYNGYFYVAAAEPETTVPTEAPTAAPETTATEPIVGGTTYYLVGSFTDWEVNADYALTANAATEGEYMITGVELAKDDEFKVLGVTAGVQGGNPTWYPDNADNYKIAADGTYDIYFRPDGNGGEGWYCNCIYVAVVEPETQPASEPETQPSSEPETQAATDAPIVGGTTYYLVGSFTDWQINADYALTANAATEGEYMITGVALAKDDEFKVVGVTAGVQDGTKWYPEGMDNNYKVAADGTYDIYFRPNYDGGEDWHSGCIYVAAAEEPSSEPETTAPETTAPETTAPETTAPVVGEEVTLYFTNNKGWGEVKAHMWKEDGASTEWPGVAATYVKDNDFGEAIYSATINTATYDHVIFNGNGGQTANIAVADAVAGGCGLYCLDTQDGEGHYNVGFYQYIAEPASEPSSEPVVGGPTYYIVGPMTNWEINSAYALTKNDASDVEEYMFEGLALTTTSMFKVARYNGGVQGGDQAWYPEGMGNNYGENGEIEADGTYTIYFRPNYDGGEDWFYNCIYVAEFVAPVTEPSTEAPTEPETQPASEPDEPFTGIKDGKYYENDVLMKGAGVVEVDGDYYFVRSDGTIFKDGRLNVTETKANGLVEPGKYNFDADGKMILNVKNGIVDGYYYVNGTLAKGAGLIEIDGDYYFVRTDGSIFKNGKLNVTAAKANNLVTPGVYKFDAEGKMILTVNEGVVDGFYYENGVLVKGKGLVEFEGNLYFVQNDGSVAKSATRGVSETKANGLADPGYYDFDADGKLIRNGIFGGKYYENNELMKGKGVVEYKGALYFVRTDGTIFKDGKVGISAAKANGYVAAGYYFADADGKLIIENQAA